MKKLQRIIAEKKKAAIEGVEQIVAGGPYTFPSRLELEALILKVFFPKPPRGRSARAQLLRKVYQELVALPIEKLIETIVDEIMMAEEEPDCPTPWVQEILHRYYAPPKSWRDRVKAALDKARATGEQDREKVHEMAGAILQDVQRGDTVFIEMCDAQDEAKVRVYQAVAADVVRRYRKGQVPRPSVDTQNRP